jgi:hypothetical protein
MKKSLNSPVEMFLYAIIIPAVWLIFLPIFWAITVESSENILLFVLFFILGPTLVFFQWKFLPLKHIEFDKENIYVSDYFNKTTIAFSEIEDIKDYSWTTYRLGSIIFATKTQLGSKIWFVPVQPNWVGFPQPNPLINELKNNVIQSREPSNNNN